MLWAAILLAVRLPFFTSLYGDMTLLCLFSFGGHVVLLAGLFVISLCPRFVIRVAHWAIGLTERVGGANDRTRGWRTYVDTEIYSFSEHFKHAAVHLSSMGVTLVVTMAQLACLYMVPYFVLRAFGNHDVDFISCLAAGAFIQLLSSAVPLPGGKPGGAEGGFCAPSWGTGASALSRGLSGLAPRHVLRSYDRMRAAPWPALVSSREHSCSLGSPCSRREEFSPRVEAREGFGRA